MNGSNQKKKAPILGWKDPYGKFKSKCEKEVQDIYDDPEIKRLIDYIKSVADKAKGLPGVSELSDLEHILKQIIDSGNCEDKLIAINRVRLKVHRLEREFNEKKLIELAQANKDKIEADILLAIKAYAQLITTLRISLDASFKKMQAEYEKLVQDGKIKLLLEQGLAKINIEIEATNHSIQISITYLSSEFTSALNNLKSDPTIVPPHLQSVVSEELDRISRDFEQGMQKAAIETHEQLRETAAKVQKALEEGVDLPEEPKPEEVKQTFIDTLSIGMEESLRQLTDRLIKEPLGPSETPEQRLEAVNNLRARITDEYQKLLSKNVSVIDDMVSKEIYIQKLEQTKESYERQLDDLRAHVQRVKQTQQAQTPSGKPRGPRKKSPIAPSSSEPTSSEEPAKSSGEKEPAPDKKKSEEGPSAPSKKEPEKGPSLTM